MTRDVTNVGVVLLGLAVIMLSLSNISIRGSVKSLQQEVENLKAQPHIEYKNMPNKYIGEHVITHYTHTGNRTASGVYPKAGRTVAVDTRVIPHGTVIYIEGIGYRIAEDTGGDIKGKRLDIFVDSHEEAVAKGVKKAKVYILK